MKLQVTMLTVTPLYSHLFPEPFKDRGDRVFKKKLRNRNTGGIITNVKTVSELEKDFNSECPIQRKPHALKGANHQREALW